MKHLYIKRQLLDFSKALHLINYRSYILLIYKQKSGLIMFFNIYCNHIKFILIKKCESVAVYVLHNKNGYSHKFQKIVLHWKTI